MCTLNVLYKIVRHLNITVDLLSFCLPRSLQCFRLALCAVAEVHVRLIKSASLQGSRSRNKIVTLGTTLSPEDVLDRLRQAAS